MQETELVNKIIALLKGLTQKEAQELLDKIKSVLYEAQIIVELKPIS